MKYVLFILPLLHVKCLQEAILWISPIRIQVKLHFFLRSCGCQARSTGSKKGELMEMLKCRKASFLTANMMRGRPFVVFHLFLKAKPIRLCSQQGLRGESEWPCLQQIFELAGEKHFATLVSHFQGYSATTQQEKVTCVTSSEANALNSN